MCRVFFPCYSRSIRALPHAFLVSASGLTSNGSTCRRALPYLVRTKISKEACPQITSSIRFFSEKSPQRHNANKDRQEIFLNEMNIADLKFNGSLELKKMNDQWGVYAIRSFTLGDIVISSKLSPTSESMKPKTVKQVDDSTETVRSTSNIRCSHSIQLGWEEHILMDFPARFLNHSCEPNVGVVGDRLNSHGSYDFVALRDIDRDEQIQFDYETTEYEIGTLFQCQCGSSICRGSIRGFKYNGEAVRKKYRKENISRYLLRGEGVF